MNANETQGTVTEKPVVKSTKPRKRAKSKKTVKATTVKLRKGQLQILKTLKVTHSRSPQASLTRDQIMTRTGAGTGWASWFLGAVDPAARRASEKSSKFPSLLTLGLISVETENNKEIGRRETRFQITKNGIGFLNNGK